MPSTAGPARDSKNYSTIEQHTLAKKKLTPPFLKVPNLEPASWMNERMPEMLWFLLLTRLGRAAALAITRELADYAHSTKDENLGRDIMLSSIAKLPDGQRAEVIKLLSASKDRRTALRPLLLFSDLPAFDGWRLAIAEDPRKDDWEALKAAVASALDHQSQQSTDARWARVIFKMADGKVHFPLEKSGLAREIAEYPNYGDQRAVRPSIRAAEGALAGIGEASSAWPEAFWAACATGSSCTPPYSPDVAQPTVGVTTQRLQAARVELVDHCIASATTTAPDARHEAAFGLGLYALAIMEELLRIGAGSALLARHGLRTLVEVAISIAYLARKADPDLFVRFRQYGAGQGKLAFLKLDQLEEAPGYVTVESLRNLANEDIWQEFVEVDLGHWAGCDLRVMSEQAGVKDLYDRFYSWPSGFVHGTWGAVRDAVYGTCMNPLHRLHRIPLPLPRTQNDVVSDAAELVDRVLESIDTLYPVFAVRLGTRPVAGSR